MLTTVVFLTLAACSFIFVSFSFLFGGDHDVDHDIDHDTGHDGGEGNSISIFSPKVVALFTLAFGSGGAAASVIGVSTFGCTLVGLACGLVLGGVAWYALNLLHHQQANSALTDAALIGCTGYVNSRIPAGGMGEVTFTSQGQSVTMLAAAKDRAEIATGAAIKVLAVGGSGVVVEPLLAA